MKIWLKYLIGIVLGVIAGIVLPFDSDGSLKILDWFVEFTIHVGRYMVVPVVFFSMVVSICKFREERRLFSVAFRTGVYIAITTLFLTILGVVLALIVKLPRIPISVEQIQSTETIDIPNLLLKFFPFSPVETFLDGSFLFPCFIFAGFLGAGCAIDRAASKATMNLFDSLSKVCYAVMCFFVDIVSTGFIALSCSWTLSFIKVMNAPHFIGIIILLFSFLLLFALGILPLVMKFIFKEEKPYKVIYGSFASFLIAFFSGDTNATLLVNIRHSKESFGIKRQLNSIVMPIFSTFSRGGSSFVCAIAFVLILRSYSSLAISFVDILWIAGISFVLSIFLGALPSGGAFVALTVMCGLYGKGFETGYLLLKPVVPFLCATACAIDSLTAMCGSYFMAKQLKMSEEKEIRHFI